MVIYTCITGQNRTLIPIVLSLYAKDGYKIIDVTYGNGNFWKDVDTNKYDFYHSDLKDGIDCRNLPYDNSVFDMVVFDPPYMHGSKTPIIQKLDATYNNNGRGGYGGKYVLELYHDGMKEAQRVLKSGGILLVKCQDQIESGKQNFDHISIYHMALELNFIAEDLFILQNPGKPYLRHKYQLHARKNHSYLWVFRKGKI